jgi:hypothetical protein
MANTWPCTFRDSNHAASGQVAAHEVVLPVMVDHTAATPT